MQPEDVARSLIAAYEGAGDLSFCYGQGRSSRGWPRIPTSTSW